MSDLIYHVTEPTIDDVPLFAIPATDDFFPVAIGGYIDFLAQWRYTADYEVRVVIDAKLEGLMAWREDAMRWRDKYLDGKIAEREAAIVSKAAPFVDVPFPDHGGRMNDPDEPAVHPDRPVGDG